MKTKLLTDADGNASSKRVAGYACLVFSMGLAVFDVIQGGSANAVQLVNAFLIAGTTMLVGGTAAEQIGKIGANK